jgi:hypothetical protein
MYAWPSPHSSAQTMSCSPTASRLTVTRYEVVMPGTASIFIRKSGTQKSWMTSREWRLNFTGCPAGRYSRGDVNRLPPSL